MRFIHSKGEDPGQEEAGWRIVEVFEIKYGSSAYAGSAVCDRSGDHDVCDL